MNRPTRRSFLKTLAAGAAATQIPTAVVSPIAQAATTQMKTTPVIDTHMHVWSGDEKRFPFDHPYDAEFEPPEIAATVERLIEEIDSHGVTHCVLVQTIYHGWDNTYTAHCVKRYPRRFKGHGLIDPTKADVAEKLEYWMSEHGLAGMRFSPIYYLDGKHGGDGWLTSEAHRRLWKKARDLKAVFNFFISTRQLPQLETMVRQYPEVKVVVDHLSRFDPSAAAPETAMKNLLALARYPHVSVKVAELHLVSQTGEYPYRDAYPWVERVYDRFGPDRLVWGTGFPGATRAQAGRPSLEQELALIEKMPFLSADDRRKILGLNAARIWSFGAPK